MPAHKALITNHFMSEAPLHEVKDEPQSGVGCETDAEEGLAHLVMNVMAELL